MLSRKSQVNPIETFRVSHRDVSQEYTLSRQSVGRSRLERKARSWVGSGPIVFIQVECDFQPLPARTLPSLERRVLRSQHDR
jgi:hypothetical protein